MNNYCNLQGYIRSVIENHYQCFMIKKNIIPNVYNGIYTNVIQCDMPVACSLPTKIPPVTGGSIVGIKDFPPGSMGCLVADNYNDYILTSNHGIAGNSDFYLKKVVVQPSPNYGGKVPKDAVGIVYRFKPVILNREDNYVDAAIVETDRSKVNASIAYVGTINKANYSAIGESVKKVGAQTELTKGILKTKYTNIIVNFLGNMVTFKNQLTTSKMSSSGDSGSILLNARNEVLGLLMADNNTISIYNTIFSVVEELNVHLVRV